MNLQEYLDLPYTKIVRKDDEGEFVAHVAELPGCVADGVTEAEALSALVDAQTLWIESALAAGDPIPEPLPSDDNLPSGKWVQRVPRTLHRQLTELAKAEGVSLNQLVTSVLAEAIGGRHARRAAWTSLNPQAMDLVSMYGSERIGSHGHWIVTSTPPWAPAGQAIATEAYAYLRALAGDIPNQWELRGPRLTLGESYDVHERTELPRVPKGRSAVRGSPQLVHR